VSSETENANEHDNKYPATRITPTADKYRIIAINKAGVGSPSNTVMVVL
jgi:hypothetical protein